jgi:DNA primase
MSVIDEVKQKTDIVSVVGQYVALKKAGRNLVGLCPFHGERNPSFFVYPEQQSWHCFGCNTGGDVFSFIMKKESMDFGEALHLLAQRAGVTVPTLPGRDEEKEEKEQLYKINKAATGYFHNLLLNSTEGKKARDYLQGRDFSDKTIADFQLGYSSSKWDDLKKHLKEQGHTEEEQAKAGLLSESEGGRVYDRFRGKLMFPIWDMRGHIIGFGARVLDDSFPKYINSPQTPIFDKSGSLYGINLAAPAIRQQETAVIVEGYVDVITAHQNGFNNVVASMGTSVTEAQVSLLKRLTRKIVLVMDSDVAGQEATFRGGEIAIQPSAEQDLEVVKDKEAVFYLNEAEVRNLQIFGPDFVGKSVLDIEVRIFILPSGKDPDDVIKENRDNWSELVNKAIPVLDYIFDRVTSKLDLDTANDKSAALESLLPILAKISDPTRFTHYKQKLSNLVKISTRELEGLLSRIKKPAEKRTIAETRQKPAEKLTARTLLSNRLEEDYLTLILQHPELKQNTTVLSPEYFLNSENREVFNSWSRVDDLDKLKDILNPALHEHLNGIAGRELPSDRLDERDADYRQRLEERYFKKLAEEIGGILAVEVAEKGSGADIAKLDEIGIEYSTRLNELYKRKMQRRLESRR